jgi:stearoyl-CoA desaturase (delta-9 desaturase)
VLGLCGHFTNAAVSIYLHRCMAHGGLKLHALAALPMRLWIWLSTGMVTREWVAVHRLHHATVDREGDPHSPVISGIFAVLFRNAFLYRKSAQRPEVLEKYARDVRQDGLERFLLGRHSWLGVALLLGIDLWLLGIGWGALVWVGQMIWMPAVGGIVNGIGHWVGYRNFDSDDESRNFLPIAVLIGGEELHNNHHADPRSARFSARWFEFDVSWLYIRILSVLGLAKILRARA